MGQCAASFSGIYAVKAANVVRSLGIVPSVSILTCVPQTSTLPAVGTLAIAHGAESIVFPDMKVDWTAMRLTTNGHLMSVKLLDRRWRWRFGRISGRYNIRLADGSIDPDTEKTPQELATLLFEALTDVGFDVSQLPNEGRPYVDWIWKRADVALHELCEDRGCDIKLGLNDAASIVRIGVGALLPFNDDLMSPSITADLPEGPDVVAVVCGETQYQSRLKLKAVGLDTDGKVKAIDDLSYKPDPDWGVMADEQYFEQLREENFSVNAIALAKKTVFRWYQIDTQADGSMDVPVYGAVDKITQLLPLNDYLLDTYTVSGGTKKTNKPYNVLGKYVILANPPDDRSEEINFYDGDSTLDKVNGILKFPRRMVKYDADGKITPADLYLETSYGVEDATTRQQERNVAERQITAGTDLKDSTRIEEIAVAIRASYGSDEITVSSTTDNRAEVDSMCENILDALQSRWTLGIYGSGIYRSIKLIETDGAIQQVEWRVSDRGGATTTASRNCEVSLGPIRRAERRRRRIAEDPDIGPRQYLDSKIRSLGVGR